MNRTSCLIGLIATALGCSEASPMATDDTSSGTGATTTVSTTTVSTTTASTTSDATTETTASTTSDATTETTDDPTTPVDTSTGPSVCDDSSSRCVAEVPTDWSGPVAIRNTRVVDAEPGCAGAYEGYVLDTFANLQAAGAVHTCECSCGPAQGVECSNVTLVGDNNNNCGSPLGSVSISDSGSCSSMPVALQVSATNYWRATSMVEGGSCDPTLDENIDPVTFEHRLTLCEGEPALGECAEGENCWPLPDGSTDGRICVWQAGDHECPDEAWTQRTLTHREIADDRGCTACSCTDLEGECDGSVFLVSSNTCMVGGQLLGNIGVGSGCTQGAVASTVQGAYVSGGLVPVEPSCTASDSTTTGGVAAADPVTVCCLPPL